MRHRSSGQTTSSPSLFALGLVLWVAIMVLTGTYLRVRAIEEAAQMDWLVAARLAACMLGGAIGVLLLARGEWRGPATTAVAAYVGAAALSALFTPHKTLVLGYWVLLAGGVALTIGLVASADERDLLRIERTWLFVMVLLLIKDALIGVLAPQLQEAYGAEGPTRLGMGVTHANALGFGASLAFWLSFVPAIGGKRALLWLLRVLLVAIVALSWSRNAMVSLAIGGLVRAWLVQSKRPLEGYHVRWALLSGVSAVVVLVGLLLSLNVKGVVDAALAFNRTTSLATVTRLTGRAEIWPLAVQKILADPLTTVFGHGFGASRMVLNDGRDLIGFYAANAHNTVLEVALTTGIVGLLAFVAMVVLFARWLVRYRPLERVAPQGMALRAAVVFTIIMVHSVTESVMGTRLGPVTLLWVFYLAVADRLRHEYIPAGA
ncbi:MAG: O-antigen ligase family protein [Calditrichaeota bacterium]|nr:O-antigen ligase family protein [Calditrichota bacterium]